ncbi:MAG TPA: sigma-70 family RNA polymerase sigma factor [Gemmatimonadaceae bacterium]|nr:sigma-70 family RNA polymerase sigma factor [Gemmatimonadaceae bacterium]
MDAQQLNEALEAAHAHAYAWALSCCRGDADLAQEVLHDVYATVLEGRARFGGQSAFTTWLFAVIRFTASKRRRREWLTRFLFVAPELGAHSTNGATPSDDAEAESRASRLRAALNELPARQREVLHLVFYENLTVEASAGVMGVSVGSARTHYARGKAKLAELIGDPETL